MTARQTLMPLTPVLWPHCWHDAVPCVGTELRAQPLQRNRDFTSPNTETHISPKWNRLSSCVELRYLLWCTVSCILCRAWNM